MVRNSKDAHVAHVRFPSVALSPEDLKAISETVLNALGHNSTSDDQIGFSITFKTNDGTQEAFSNTDIFSNHDMLNSFERVTGLEIHASNSITNDAIEINLNSKPSSGLGFIFERKNYARISSPDHNSVNSIKLELKAIMRDIQRRPLWIVGREFTQLIILGPLLLVLFAAGLVALDRVTEISGEISRLSILILFLLLFPLLLVYQVWKLKKIRMEFPFVSIEIGKDQRGFEEKKDAIKPFLILDILLVVLFVVVVNLARLF